jgi:hypothetical protein
MTLACENWELEKNCATRHTNEKAGVRFSGNVDVLRCARGSKALPRPNLLNISKGILGMFLRHDVRKKHINK